MHPPEATTLLIIGGGFGGIGAAIQAQQRGLTDLLLLERASALGGTWRDNRYPGAACDIPSHLYSFSFEKNPRWSRTYAGHAEINAYLADCANRHGILSKCRFDATVSAATWSEADGRWTVTTADGRQFVARFVIFGVGGLKDPRWPSIPGLRDFAGPIVHSARWPADLDLRGKRVALVGTGASAIQIVPAIAPTVASLHLFQRTPAWIVPREDRAYSAAAQAAFAQVPGLMQALRTFLYAAQEVRYPLIFRQRGLLGRLFEGLMRRGIAQAIADPAKARALTPDYAAGCKRILISSDFYPALNQPHVHLHTEAIAAIEADGLRCADGSKVEADLLICCTGFTVDEPLGSMQVIGRGGVDLNTAWAGRPQAYLGVTVPGFPNAFLLLGPNTALGHNSVVIMIEAQIGYALDAIFAAQAAGPQARVDVREEALQAFIAEVDAALAGQIWASGCRSWYQNERGQNFTIWPGTTLSYRWRLRRFDAEAYRIDPLPAQAPPRSL